MNDKIQKAFDDITAPESLKTRTTRQVIAKRQNRKHISFFRPVYALAATALLLIAFAGYGMYFTPRSVISVDINPSVEMEVNMFDRVISVKGYNEDGRRPADSVDVIHQNYYTALDSLINSEIVQNCLADRQGADSNPGLRQPGKKPADGRKDKQLYRTGGKQLFLYLFL